MPLRPYQRAYAEPSDADTTFASALALALFALRTPELTPRHRRRLLKEAIWWVTEIGGKYACRYKSTGVLELRGDAAEWWRLVRHEHVFPRSRVAAELVEQPDRAAEILRQRAVACVVTPAEHERLTTFDKEHTGWNRYAAAGIDVVDMITRDRVVDAGVVVGELA